MPAYLIAGLLAAAVAYGVMATAYPYFVLPDELANLPVPAPAEDLARQEAGIREVTLHNAMLVLGIFGAALAVGAGLVEGLSRRAIVGSLLSVPLGAVLGLGAGIGGAYLADMVLWNFTGDGLTLLECGAATAIVFAPLGLAFGVTAGIAATSLRSMFKAGLFGLVAGALTAVFYVLIVGVFFANAPIDGIVPATVGTRVLWLCMPALAISLIVAASEQSKAAAR